MALGIVFVFGQPENAPISIVFVGIKFSDGLVVGRFETAAAQTGCPPGCFHATFLAPGSSETLQVSSLPSRQTSTSAAIVFFAALSSTAEAGANVVWICEPVRRWYSATMAVTGSSTRSSAYTLQGAGGDFPSSAAVAMVVRGAASRKMARPCRSRTACHERILRNRVFPLLRPAVTPESRRDK